MKTAIFKVIVAGDPIWWQGQTLEGAHGWTPSILHPSALNHAVCSALAIEGIRGRRIRVGDFQRQLHHSRVSPSLWVSPALAIHETLRPVDTTLVSISADYGHMLSIPPEKGKQGIVINDEGCIDYRAPGIEATVGKPKRMLGWLGEWEGRIFWDNIFDMPDDMVVSLGPLSAQCALYVGKAFDVVADPNPEGVIADHLVDPALLQDDVTIVNEVGAMPWALAEVMANARAGEAPVYWVE